MQKSINFKKFYSIYFIKREIEKEKDQEELKYKREFKKYDQSRSESIKNIEKLLHDVASTFHR